jgi:predicted Ser/Thr protein kinase
MKRDFLAWMLEEAWKIDTKFLQKKELERQWRAA